MNRRHASTSRPRPSSAGSRRSLAVLATAVAVFATAAAAADESMSRFAGKDFAALVPTGWTTAWNANNRMILSRHEGSGGEVALFVGRKLGAQAVPDRTWAEFVSKVFGRQVQRVRGNDVAGGRLLEYRTQPAGADAVVATYRHADYTAFAVMAIEPGAIAPAAARRITTSAARSVGPLAGAAKPQPGPAPPAGGTRQAGRLYVGVRFAPATMSVGGSGVTRYNLLLLADGTAFAGIPPGGRLDTSRTALAAAAPPRLGTWRDTGASIEAHWPARSAGRQQQVFGKHGDQLNYKGTDLKQVACPRGEVRLAGHYRAQRSAAVGFDRPGTPAAMLGASSEYRFTRDGRFAASVSAGVAGRAGGGAGAGTTQRAIDGRYALRGCALTLESAATGSTVRTAFFWPGEGDKLLVIGGREYLRQ